MTLSESFLYYLRAPVNTNLREFQDVLAPYNCHGVSHSLWRAIGIANRPEAFVLGGWTTVLAHAHMP